ncbi:MAG: hypothetical protein LRS45_03075 [Desulfurococcales archaeon]|nr:hypothetical protein [Desulfurococcales archaeon]
MNIEPAKIRVRCTGDGNTFKVCDQAVHPSIIYDTKRQLFTIGITPYPFGDPRFENPSVLFSRDLRLLLDHNSNNPLLPPPPDSAIGGHYADPEIFYFNNKMHMLIGVTSKALKMDGYLYFTINAQGKRTSEPVFIDIPFSKNVSLSVICGDRDCYYWTVNPGAKPFEITLYRVTWDSFPHPSSRMKVKYEITYNGEKWNVWHLSVRRTNSGKYYMLAAANPVGSWNGSPPMHLFLLGSNDGSYFEDFYGKPLIAADKVSRIWHLYRSDFMILNGRIEGLVSYSNTGLLGVYAEKHRGSIVQKGVTYLYKRLGRYSYREWFLARFIAPWGDKGLSEKTNNVINS